MDLFSLLFLTNENNEINSPKKIYDFTVKYVSIKNMVWKENPKLSSGPILFSVSGLKLIIHCLILEGGTKPTGISYNLDKVWSGAPNAFRKNNSSPEH